MTPDAAVRASLGAKLQAALAVEVDGPKDEDPGPAPRPVPHASAPVKRHADDAGSVALQQRTGGLQQPGTVIDDETAHGHAHSLPVSVMGVHSG